MRNKLTLYVSRLLTTQDSEALRPKETVTFGIGSTNLGPFFSLSVDAMNSEQNQKVINNGLERHTYHYNDG